MSFNDYNFPHIIHYRASPDKFRLRYYVIDTIYYDFEYNTRKSLDLIKTGENMSFGSIFAANKYACELYTKYCKTLGTNIRVVIDEKFAKSEVDDGPM